MLKLFGRNPFVLFYIVSGYIIVFTLWWAYLLASKNETAFIEKVELDRVNYQALGQAQKYEDTDSYLKIYTKYKRQRVMIMGEGLFFLALQILGLLQVRRIFGKEMELAVQQRNFLHSITHELKSPLSSVKLSMQTLIKRTLEPEQKTKLINNALGDIVRLESLVDNILFAAKIERDTHGFADEEVSVSDIVLMVAEKFRENKKEIRINTHIQEEVYYTTDMVGFTSVVMNLIENAIKYSAKGSAVDIYLTDTDTSIALQVKDEGYGIPDEEKKKVFEKFYRIGNEDTRNTKGTGLGLFIVSRFVEIYKGRIDLLDNTPKGSVFSLSFPK
ncbi:MAG: integral rane sensor signal transduction histidine kinase [Bacteroidetes bacterium]|nr:integral rane sensor signal transduction histidine kinase [Bacteroidota bacterium]